MYVCVKIHFNSLFFNEYNRNYVKIIISPSIKNHVLIESKQSKTDIFFKIVQPQSFSREASAKVLPNRALTNQNVQSNRFSKR